MTKHANYPTAVRNLQAYLRQLSHAGEDITMPPLDSIFESNTEQALRDFQRTRGLEETGVADLETWELLYAAYRASLAERTIPQSVDLFPRFPLGFRLRMGARSFTVSALQYMLSELEALYGGMEQISISGIYDTATADAVGEFQRVNLLPVTNEVDLLTWNLIADQHNLLFGQEERE